MVVLDTVVLAVKMEQETIVVTLMFLVVIMVEVLDVTTHISQKVVKEQLELFGVKVEYFLPQILRIWIQI
jgi:hypothetical protein